MLCCAFLFVALICLVCPRMSCAQLRSTTLVRSSLEDESIILIINKSVYFPGDTVRLVIERTDSVITVKVTPIIAIEGAKLHIVSPNTYIIAIPEIVTPGSYHIFLKVLDDQGRRFVYQTDCIVVIEEHQAVERIGDYTSIAPSAGSMELRHALTLHRGVLRNLCVIFLRDSIREQKGPQFVTIRTTVISREGVAIQTLERRVLTFRSHGDPERDRAMFIQYRTAYGAYAALRMEELDLVPLNVDSLPSWAIVKVNIEPDYTIKIGAYDRTNSITQFFRVRGPKIEMGFTLGIPKVLYDTQAQDTLDYGKTSATLRFYYINQITGHRFPLNLGVGTFGLNSPIDVGTDRGGFTLPLMLDVFEVLRILNLDFFKKLNGGLELTPFFPIQKNFRLLLDAQISFSL